MNDTLQASSELKAIDLVRVNIDALPPDELDEHATQVLDTIAALNAFCRRRLNIEPPCRSNNEPGRVADF